MNLRAIFILSSLMLIGCDIEIVDAPPVASGSGLVAVTLSISDDDFFSRYKGVLVENGIEFTETGQNELT